MDFDLTKYCREVDETGFSIIEDIFPPQKVESLRSAVEEVPLGEEVRRKSDVYGIRNLLEVSAVIAYL